MQKNLIILLLSLLLINCSNFPSKAEQLYLENKNGEKLTVPHPLTDSQISNFYTLPIQEQNPRISTLPPNG